MKHPRVFVSWAVLLVAVVVFTPLAALARARRLTSADTIDYVVAVFGDSLSDTGNVFQAAGVPDPSYYYKGRFCDGPVWVDYLRDLYANNTHVKIINYSYGRSTACNNTENEVLYPFVKDLASQTEAFLADVKEGRVVLGPNAKLVILQWTGNNDFVPILTAALSAGTFPSAQQLFALSQAVTGCRLASVKAIAAALRLPIEAAIVPASPFYIAPLVPEAAKATVKQVSDLLDRITAEGVKALGRAFVKAKPGTPGYKSHVHNIGKSSEWIAGLVKQIRPRQKYTDDVPCFYMPSAMVITPGLKLCSDPNEHTFFDPKHPGTLYQKWFGLEGLLPRLQQIGLLP